MEILSPLGLLKRFKQKKYERMLRLSEEAVIEFGLMGLVQRLNMRPGAVNVFLHRHATMTSRALSVVWYYCRLRGVGFVVVNYLSPDMLKIIACVTSEDLAGENGDADEDSESHCDGYYM